jgi:hypothetical protein
MPVYVTNWGGAAGPGGAPGNYGANKPKPAPGAPVKAGNIPLRAAGVGAAVQALLSVPGMIAELNAIADDKGLTRAERDRAISGSVGRTLGQVTGAGIGAAIGAVILPGIGAPIGMAIGSWLAGTGVEKLVEMYHDNRTATDHDFNKENPFRGDSREQDRFNFTRSGYLDRLEAGSREELAVKYGELFKQWKADGMPDKKQIPAMERESKIPVYDSSYVFPDPFKNMKPGEGDINLNIKVESGSEQKTSVSVGRNTSPFKLNPAGYVFDARAVQ